MIEALDDCPTEGRLYDLVVGTVVRKLRSERGWTQSALASQISSCY